MTGYNMSEFIGCYHKMFIGEEYLFGNSKSKEYKEFWKKLKRGEFISGEFERTTKNGSKIWLQASYNPIIDESGNVYKIMKIATDITIRIEQSEELEQKNTYLEHAAKILRHDMHSGINTYIPRGISSLERRLTEEDIKSLKIEAPLRMIKEGLKHTQKVYKGVYEFTNLVKKDVVLSKIDCDIKAILSDYLSSTSYKSQVILDENLPTIEVNESLFCTSIDNLIRNGLKYNDSDNKIVKIYLEDDFICVVDNGRGLTQEDFLHLSKPYVRKEDQKESGSGLGLNICIAILKEHGFSITAEKIKEGGTKLKIKIK
jgi:PAS domain S-box-containing protein